MKNNDAAIQWAVDYLESNDCRLVSVQKIVEPAHSIVVPRAYSRNGAISC
ncbi:Uncharacterised protein [Fluoribacter dumoffii]|uniref:Uncharacterized protein n=1 Tax=Fluoribacter dumoffii TaxID=463 RepID=A0A377GAY4_9GAMM|nr:Uncharacterised protein [Fluoribacter dumoffii]